MNPYLAAVLTVLFIVIYTGIGTLLSVYYSNVWILIGFVFVYAAYHVVMLFRQLRKLDKEQQQRNSKS